MAQIKVAYLKQLGNKELKQAKKIFAQKHPECEISLVGTNYQTAFALLKRRQVDLVITDGREKRHEFYQKCLVAPGLMAILQKGTYPAGMQMIDKDKLRDLTCFLICSPQEEKEELNLHEKIWQLESPFMAVNDFDEAGVLIAGGSGYFVMNELTAKLINNDTLQKLFLLSHGKQIKQEYDAFWRKEQKDTQYLVSILQKEYQKAI